MLVLSRFEKQAVVLTVGDIRIEVVVSRLGDRKVSLGFDAPPEVVIHRREIQRLVDGRQPDDQDPQS